MSARRRYSDSSDDEDGRPRHKRRRNNSGDAENSIEDRLESLILRIGDKSTSSLESNLENLSLVLEADLSNFKGKIIKFLCECVTEMPEKLTIYSTLVGLLNAKNFTAGGDFVESLVRQFKEAARANEFDKARLIVRFISDLVNCHVITASSLLNMYDSFLEVALEDNIPQVRSDWYIYCVMSSLPWVGRELAEKKEADVGNLLLNIEEHLSKRQKIHVAALRVWSSDNPHPQEEYLDCLWAQIQDMKAGGWQEKQIVRPYLSFDSILSEALQHNLPTLIPPSHNEDTNYPLPAIQFRMFDYTDVPEGPTMPGAHAIERYLIEDHLHGILASNSLERKACASALLSFPVKLKIPLNYMIVEVVFSQLFRMPRPPYLELFYGSLFIELCKLQPGSMPQVLAQAAEMLYERIDTMNTACIERFALWFSYHLSNFQFRWSWQDWAECLQLDIMRPKPMFVREVLLKGMRLSYHQRMLDIMPEEFKTLLPDKPAPHYKFAQEEMGDDVPGTNTALKVCNAIKSKCTNEEVVSILKECPNPSSEQDFNPLKIDVFVQTLLNLGAKSFSHSFAAIAKFHAVLKALGENEEQQVCILKAVYELWRPHQQMIVVLVDKLLKTQIVECSSVANWIFSPDMQNEFTNFFVWEIIHSTIKKMNKHVAKLQKDVEEAKDKSEAAQRRANDGFDFDLEEDIPTQDMIERMEEKLEAAQGEQKNLFLIIFQRFIIILTEHLARCESEQKDYNTAWYKWVIERLQQVFLMHHEQVYRYINTLENLMFTSDIDIHILEVFQQFCALRS